jgi:plasmid stability protein
VETETRNITFCLPKELIRKAKVYAAEHDTSVNALVRDLLQDALLPESPAVTATRRFLALSDSGPLFTADPGLISRDELHER